MPLTIRTPLPTKTATKVTFTILYFYFVLYIFTQLWIPKQYRLPFESLDFPSIFYFLCKVFVEETELFPL